MEKEKQIEEMERIIDEKGEFIISDSYDAFIKVKMACKTAAERLYNAGYRKQSEGEWIEASNKPYAACGKKCSLCGARISYREYGHGNHKYCHKCGAKMKGGEE